MSVTTVAILPSSTHQPETTPSTSNSIGKGNKTVISEMEKIAMRDVRRWWASEGDWRGIMFFGRDGRGRERPEGGFVVRDMLWLVWLWDALKW